MELKKRVREFAPNFAGSDYFVGDLHGHFDQLQELLDAVAFGPDDRLFAVGDLVDRGPRSWDLLRWFGEAPNCFSVLGNHDALLAIHSAPESRIEATRLWASMGCEWVFALDEDESRFASVFVEQLPLGMSIQLSDGRRLGVIHADLPLKASWVDFCGHADPSLDVADSSGIGLNEAAIWGRIHALAAVRAAAPHDDRMELSTRYALFRVLQALEGLDLLIAGHTPLPGRRPLLAENRLFIDTGNYRSDGWLTMVDPVGRRAWQAPNLLETDPIREIDWSEALRAERYRLADGDVDRARRMLHSKWPSEAPTNTRTRLRDDVG